MAIGERDNVKNDMVLNNICDDLVVSDQKESLNALALDTAFVENLISQRTLKDMQKLFANRGVILSENEVDNFIEMVKSFSTKLPLPDAFFEDAAAGSRVLNNTGMLGLANKTADIISSNPDRNDFSDSVFWI